MSVHLGIHSDKVTEFVMTWSCNYGNIPYFCICSFMDIKMACTHKIHVCSNTKAHRGQWQNFFVIHLPQSSLLCLLHFWTTTIYYKDVQNMYNSLEPIIIWYEEHVQYYLISRFLSIYMSCMFISFLWINVSRKKHFLFSHSEYSPCPLWAARTGKCDFWIK